MKIFKKYKYHIILIVALIFIAGLTELTVYLHIDNLRESPLTLGRFLKIYPAYNEHGSWIHGKLGIGYSRWFLLFERIFMLLSLFFIFRFMRAHTQFYRMSAFGLFSIDFGIAVAIYRLGTVISDRFTLDYLYLGHNIYDLPDLYIGIQIITILVWLVPALIKYYSHRKVKVMGMSFLRKQLWDLKIAGMFFKAAVISDLKWEKEFEPWR